MALTIKERPGYDGYLLIEDDYVKESFRVLFENFKDLEGVVNEIIKEVDQIKTDADALETRVVTLENA